MSLSLKLIREFRAAPTIRFGLARHLVTSSVTLNKIELYRDHSHVRESDKFGEIDPAACLLAARLSEALSTPIDIIKREV